MSNPTLPLEVVEQILVLALSSTGSFAEFAQLTSLCAAIRAAMFESLVVRSQVLLGAHGKDNVLAALAGSSWLSQRGSAFHTPRALIAALIQRGANAANGKPLQVACAKIPCKVLVEGIVAANPSNLQHIVSLRDSEAFRDACRFNHIDIVEILIGAGANVHARADEALRLSACSGNSAMVSVLIKNGATVSALQNAPLFGAIDRGHETIVTSLLEAGADPNIPMNGVVGGRSALLAAIARGSAACVKSLVAHGANVLHDDCIAKREAIRRKLDDIVVVLEEAEYQQLNAH
ncbi:hypothetical protein HDU98_004230 [Podochytrium sp. JEL0797]|nr:hypothetical protein HDU98_004230 [Podochytrium sp. JEL0797]